MGYTHYWDVKSPCNFTEWTMALRDCRKIIKASGLPLANGHGTEGTKPRLTDGIGFNGAGRDSHETFSLPKVPIVGFDFCKTNRKPYDLVVTACLARLALVPGVSVSSDGGPTDWELGRAFAEFVLMVKIPNPIGE